MGVSFGEKIKSARKAKGLTQKQLAAKMPLITLLAIGKMIRINLTQIQSNCFVVF